MRDCSRKYTAAGRKRWDEFKRAILLEPEHPEFQKRARCDMAVRGERQKAARAVLENAPAPVAGRC